MSQGAPWVLGEAARKLAARLESSWRALPLSTRRQWARAMLAAVISVFVSLGALIFVLSRILPAAHHFSWEADVLRSIEAGPIGFGSAVWLQTLGSDFMLAAIAILVIAVSAWRRHPIFAATVLLSLVVMDAAVRIGWFLFARERPDLVAQGLAAPAFHAFPSGHTAKTVAVYGVLVAQWLRASRNRVERIVAIVLFLLISLAVPFSRLRMGAHWPTDVMGGYLLGVVWLSWAVLALKREPVRRS